MQATRSSLIYWLRGTSRRCSLVLGAAVLVAAPGCKTAEGGGTRPPAVQDPDSGTPAADSAQSRANFPAPPPPSDPRPVNFPEAQQFRTDNGLTVYVVENHEVPLVTSRLIVRAGEMDQEHVAEFTGMMLGEGTKSRSKAKIDESIEFVGGRLGSGSSTHASFVFSHVRKQDLRLALTLMADEVQNPTFPQDALEKLKEQAKTGISAAKAQPGLLAAVLFDMVAYPPGHPYGRPLPTDAEIDAVNLDDIKKFHKTFFHANNSVLILSGDITVAEAKPMLQRVFGKWSAIDASALPPHPLGKFKNYEQAKELVVHLVDRPGSAQTEILIGNLALSRNHPDWIKLQLVDLTLGSGSFGRLYKDVREKHGLTYGISSEVSEAQGPGTFAVSTRTRTKTTGEILKKVFEHLEAMRSKGLTDAELARAIGREVDRFPLEVETSEQIARKVQESVIYRLPDNYWQTYRDDVANVELGEVNEAARKYIHPVPHVVVVGKASKIEPQIKKALPKAKIVKYDGDLKPIK